ncbi:MAG: M20/M25/M40 family metallo-hydrolase [Candidatus Latescibacteria bacterium]|nr:M20/M25/M40 family metallo-hydrolase [Candidatus Latescibacterota bacterium]
MARPSERSCADWLRLITALPGVPGQERAAAEGIAKAFRSVADRVERDRMGSVYAWIDGTAESPRPLALLAAHMDKIGFLVRSIEPGGYLRLSEVGGFDSRTLPGKEVTVHAKPPMAAVFATRPPHLQKKGESEKPIPLEDLYLDTGRPEREVRRKVPIGTMVTLRQPPVDLLGDRIAAPGMDDRAGVVVMLRAIELLRAKRPACDVVAVATVEEEFGVACLGARTATENLTPDLGIAIDVSHGDMVGAREGETFPLGSGPALAVGGNIHPRILEGLRTSAKSLGMPFRIEPCPTGSGTDAMDIQIAARGVPTAVVGIPCRYMHSGVETVEPRDVDRCAHLLAHYLSTLSPEWSALEVLK